MRYTENPSLNVRLHPGEAYDTLEMILNDPKISEIGPIREKLIQNLKKAGPDQIEGICKRILHPTWWDILIIY